MEKKTIGGFIAALRKANGMTQKELAARLNVSDKTVSRWERDDGAPDLSLIPVIAEIFGVTCDELLRGERRPPTERRDAAQETDAAPRADKQRRHMLKAARMQYTNRSFIAMGISVAGALAALVCNFALLKGALGFYLGAIFFVASAVCQAVFVNKAFFSVEDAELEPSALSGYRREVIALAGRVILLLAGLFGFTLPMGIAGAHAALRADSLLLLGTMCAAAMFVVGAALLYGLRVSLIKRGVIVLTQREAAVFARNHRLKRYCASAMLAALAVTAVMHYASTRIWGPGSIMKGTAFEDYESFIAYMAQDVHYDDPVRAAIASAAQDEDDSIYYDQYGNEISEEQALTRTLEDRNGNVVCTYVDRNQSVISIRYTPGDGTILPITVCTREDLRLAEQTATIRHVIFAVVYGAQCLAALLVYLAKRAK